MLPPVHVLEPGVAVTGQVQPNDLPGIAAAGYTIVVNNRPDREALLGQPRTADLAEAAHSAGLRFVDLPFTATRLSRPQVAAFAALMADPDARILAFCKSGMRSTLIWAAAAVASGRPAADVIAVAARAGTDLTPLRELITSLGSPGSSEPAD